jgi:hypothetical protein
MRSPFLDPSPRRLATIAARSAGVVLLTPLILLAGIVAVVALAAIGLARPALRARRIPRVAGAPAVVLRLRPAPADAALARAGRRAA